VSVDIQDTAVATALERATGHPSPYTDAELASVRELRVVGAGSLSELAGCDGLEQLGVVGSDVTELGALSSLKQLRVLHVLACPVTSGQGLIGLDRLEELRLDFTFVEDAAPVFSLPALRRARLLGNPWNAESWRRLREQITSKSPQAATPRPIFELGAESEVELEVTQRLRAFGLDLCFGSLDVLRTVLVRPGKPRLTGQECDWTVASTAGAWLEAKGDWTTDTFFEMIHDFRTRRGENEGFDFESHRQFGDRDDAYRWIIEENDAGSRASLQCFIDHFPGATFFREDDAFQAMVERRGGVLLPTWYRRARKILAGAFPERSAEYRVDRFEGNSPSVTNLPEVWYRSRFENYDSDEGPTIRDVARVYPFAFWPVQKRSVLAVSLDDAQPGIHEYGEPDIFDTLRLGQPATASLYRVYPSYAALLAHIAAFKLPDGTVIEAAED
jgi:hypothetical protein